MQAAIALDDYANSMFRFEHLHDGWIDACAAYLTHIFGPRLHGACVIDYAFGRGNWSVAFLRAGAKEVTAIDASASNVQRFSAYCTANGLKRIKVIEGNVCEAPVEAQGDILWLYGILPAIPDQSGFLAKTLSLLSPAPEALVLAYGYNRSSLRHWLVNAARACLTYPDEISFRADSLAFTPPARLRARDDLTAPHVEWHSAQEMAVLFAPFRFAPLKQVKDFRIFSQNWSEEEFSPQHVLFARGAQGIALQEPENPYHADIALLDQCYRCLLPALSAPERKALAIGLFNTHFSALGAKGEAGESIKQLFLLLLYGLMNKHIPAEQFANADGRALYLLAQHALKNQPRPPLDSALAHTQLTRWLCEQSIRI